MTLGFRCPSFTARTEVLGAEGGRGLSFLERSMKFFFESLLFVGIDAPLRTKCVSAGMKEGRGGGYFRCPIEGKWA